MSYYHINGLKYYKADNVVIDNSRKFSPSVYTADEAEVAEHYHLPQQSAADKPAAEAQDGAEKKEEGDPDKKDADE